METFPGHRQAGFRRPLSRGDTAYVGEQSPTGTLYAVDVHTGDIRWQYAASDFVGSDPSQRSYPSVVHIAVDGKGTVYANCYRFLMQKTAAGPTPGG